MNYLTQFSMASPGTADKSLSEVTTTHWPRVSGDRRDLDVDLLHRSATASEFGIQAAVLFRGRSVIRPDDYAAQSLY